MVLWPAGALPLLFLSLRHRRLHFSLVLLQAGPGKLSYAVLSNMPHVQLSCDTRLPAMLVFSAVKMGSMVLSDEFQPCNQLQRSNGGTHQLGRAAKPQLISHDCLACCIPAWQSMLAGSC